MSLFTIVTVSAVPCPALSVPDKATLCLKILNLR